MNSQKNLQNIATEFLTLAATVRVREAYSKFTTPTFKHHNAYFPGDAESLAAAMEENAKRNPEKKLVVKRVLEDGDTVAIFSHVTMKPDELGYALMHMFRFEGEKIAELWDIGQAVPENSPNQHGMF